MSCSKDHSGNIPKAKISALEDSQSNFWRHKCAGCAYEMGRADAAEAEDRLRTRVRQPGAPRTQAPARSHLWSHFASVTCNAMGPVGRLSCCVYLQVPDIKWRWRICSS